MARPGLTRHRKFVRLSRLLGSRALAFGVLGLLWEVAYEAGDEVVGSAEDVEHAADWKGEAGFLVGALVSSGFLDPPAGDGRDGRDGYAIHDLWHHAPAYVTVRHSLESERRKPKTCGGCGGTFQSPDYRAKYCSHACRQVAYRGRRVTDRDELVTDRDAPPSTQHPAPSTHGRPARVTDEPPNGKLARNREERAEAETFRAALSERLGRRVGGVQAAGKVLGLVTEIRRLGFGPALQAAEEAAAEMDRRGDPLQSVAALPGWLKTCAGSTTQ